MTKRNRYPGKSSCKIPTPSRESIEIRYLIPILCWSRVALSRVSVFFMRGVNLGEIAYLQYTNPLLKMDKTKVNNAKYSLL